MNSAVRTLIPLLLLIPLLIWLTRRVIRRQLAPVRRLADGLDRQSPDQPQPLPSEGVPDEVVSFVLAINRLLARIALLMDQQRRFIADAAHELRTPLTALSVQAENLEKAYSIAAMRGRIGPLHAGIGRARRLTEQLLTLARTQAGGTQRGSVEVSVVIRQLIADLLPLAEERGIDLGLDETATPTLFTDADTLRLILKTGLENAIRYSPPSGQITVRIDETNEDVIVEIIDAGPGIPASERERAFDPFRRLPGAVGEGSGLGLTIARDAAMRIGGAVTLHDRSGEAGLVFRFRIARGSRSDQ